MSSSHKIIICPRCGTQVCLPKIWIFGIEVVFRCPECRRPFKTGFKMGALIFGLALALALGTANILIFLLSSITTPIFAIMVIPLWVFYGFLMRRSYLLHRIRRQQKRTRRNSSEV